MKSQSNTLPQSIERLQGRILINFDIKEVDGIFEYEQVKVSEGASREEIIDSVIRSRYSVSDEFALINNFNQGKDSEQYLEFQNFRKIAKEIADQVL